MTKKLKEWATVIGLNEALVVNQVRYWGKTKSAKERDGKKGWFYKKFEDWANQDFPFWSEKTIKRTMKTVIDLGLVETGVFNDWVADRTKWYRVVDDLDARVQEIKVENEAKQSKRIDVSHKDKMSFSIGSNCPYGTGQNDPSNNQRIHPESTPRNSDRQSVADAQQNSDSPLYPQEKDTSDESGSNNGTQNNRLLDTIVTQLVTRRHLDELPLRLGEPVPAKHLQHAYQLCIDYARELDLNELYEVDPLNDTPLDDLAKYQNGEVPDYESIHRSWLKKMFVEQELSVNVVIEAIEYAQHWVKDGGRKYGFNFKDVYYAIEDLGYENLSTTENQYACEKATPLKTHQEEIDELFPTKGGEEL